VELGTHGEGKDGPLSESDALELKRDQIPKIMGTDFSSQGNRRDGQCRRRVRSSRGLLKMARATWLGEE